MDILTSDDSNDSEYKQMREQLCDYGFGNENLNKEEMSDLLKALSESKEESQLNKTSPPASETPGLRRRWIRARDARMPWSALPPELSPAQRARSLAAYGALLAARRNRQARLSLKMAEWPAPLTVPERSPRPARSTRSGRAAPHYHDPDVPKRRRTDVYAE